MVLVLILKNVIENQKFNFPAKLYEKNARKQNCSFQKNLQNLSLTIF